MQNYTRIACGALGILLLAISLWLSQSGFNKILEFRMLERIPLSTVAGAISGEIQLRGEAIAIQTLSSPKTQTPSIYYRYLIEREVRDSDGNRSWRTVSDEQRGLDFTLRDQSGATNIKLGVSTRYIEVNVQQKYQTRNGDFRYTEWRLESGETITLFGWLESTQPHSVTFVVQGDYLPILSTFGAAAERSSIGAAALFWLWGGISAMILTCLAAMAVFQIHRTLVFLTAICLSSMFVLLHFGYQSLENDVATGFRQIQNHFERSQLAVNQAQRDESAVMNYLLRSRYRAQISQFPESLYARTNQLDEPPKVLITAAQQQSAMVRVAQFAPTRVSDSFYLIPLSLAVAALLAWLAFRIIRVKRIQENLPTSKTAGVTYGITEVVGILKAEDDLKLFKGPVSKKSCTWYRYLVEERRGSGKNRRWVTITDEKVKQPFLIKDDEGELRVFPGRADIITRHRERRQDGSRRHTEWRLAPGDDLYVLGKARLDKTRGDTLVLGHEPGIPYIIANLPESEVMFRKAIKGMALLSGGASILFFVAIWLSGSNGSFSSMDFLQAAAIAPAFLMMVVLIMMFNDLIFLRERCERNWANIQVSLKKRANLIPRLESVVKEYLSHEQNLQTGLALLRERSQNINNSRDMDRYMAAEHVSITELSAHIEQYPDLKGTDLVADFHRRLVKLENEVALIRSGFNDAVTQYLIRLQKFPDNIVARLFRFKPKTRLAFSKAAHSIPKAFSDQE